MSESNNVKKAFGDDANQYKSGSAKVITTALVVGLHLPELKSKVDTILYIQDGWKDNPDEVIVVMRDVAVQWRTVEQTDKLRRISRGTKKNDDASFKFGGAAKMSGGGKNRGKPSISIVNRTSVAFARRKVIGLRGARPEART